MNILRNIFILPIFSLLLFINLAFTAQAATLDEVKTYFEEMKSKYLKQGDTLTYSVFEEKEEDRFLVKDVKLNLAKNTNLLEFKQIEFTFIPDAIILNSSLSDIIAKEFTRISNEARGKIEIRVDQINVKGAIKLLDGTFIVPEPTTFLASKFSRLNVTTNGSTTFEEFKLVDFQMSSREDFSFKEATLSPTATNASQTATNDTATNDKVPIRDSPLMMMTTQGMTIKGIKVENNLLHSAELVEIGKIQASGSPNLKDQDKRMHVDFAFDGFSVSDIMLNLNAALYNKDKNPDPEAPFMPFDAINFLVKPISLQIDGATVFSSDEMKMDFKLREDRVTFDYVSNISDLFVDIEKLNAISIPNDAILTQKQLDQIVELGLEKVNLNLDLTSSWNRETGLVDVPKYLIDIKQIGTLNYTLKLGGFTEKFLKELQTEFNVYPDSLDQQNLLAKKIEEKLLQNITIESLTTKITDRNFLHKVLLFIMKSQAKAEQTRHILGPLVGVVMAPYNMPEFSKKLSEAVSTFMAGNKSIEIAINPANPISLLELEQFEKDVNAKIIQPAEILKRLNLSVKAE